MPSRFAQGFRFIATGALASLLFSCQSMVGPAPAPRANPCASGTPPASAIVCIDDSDLTIKPPANPDKAYGQRSRAVQWFTVSGTGSIAILPESPDVLRNITCTPNGHCSGVVSSSAKYNTDYKYTIVVQKGSVVSPPNDPILVIKP